MGTIRISVYGKDADNHQNLMFDQVNGKLYIEVNDSYGHKCPNTCR